MIKLYKNTDNQEICLDMDIINLIEFEYRNALKPYKTFISFLKKNIDNIGIIDVVTDNSKIYHINIVCGGGNVKTSKFYSLLDKIDIKMFTGDLIKFFNDSLILTDN